MSDKLLTVAQVARILGVSRMTIYRRIDAGEIPVVKDYRKFVHIKLSVVSEIVDQIKRENGEISE